MCSSTTSEAAQTFATSTPVVRSSPSSASTSDSPATRWSIKRHRVDRGRDEVGADARGDDRVDETGARGALDVEADGQPGRLADACDQLLRDVRQEGVGRVVDDDPGGAELRDLLRLLDEQVDLAAPASAVDEAGVERLPRGDDRVARRLEVRDVVERVVKAEDVDAVLGGTANEARDDVGRHGPRADEEAAAKRDPERRRRARIDRPDPLPRALDAAADGRIERAAARHLEM